MTIAEVAQVDYTAACIRIEQMARDMSIVGDSDKAALFRFYASIAYAAGRAERIDPEPSAVSICGICHGFLACDWDVHRRAG